jgi:hypothetical protein
MTLRGSNWLLSARRQRRVIVISRRSLHDYYDMISRVANQLVSFGQRNHCSIMLDSSRSTPTPTAFARLRQRPSSIAEQISTFASPGEGITIEDLPRISVQRKQYVQEASIDKKANTKRYSWIGDHGVYLVEIDGNRKLNTFWSCSECDRLGDSQLYDTGTTSNAERHLRNKHKISKPGSTIAQSPPPNVIAMQILGAKRRKISDVPTTADAGHLFRKTLVRWMVKANIPLTGTEDVELPQSNRDRLAGLKQPR